MSGVKGLGSKQAYIETNFTIPSTAAVAIAPSLFNSPTFSQLLVS